MAKKDSVWAYRFGVEIFSVGEQTSAAGTVRQWTRDDLDNMVTTFKSGVPEIVSLKIGHSSDSFNEDVAKALGVPPIVLGGDPSGDTNDGVVSLGRVIDVYRDGDRLLSNWEIPVAVNGLVDKGFLRSVSAEIFPSGFKSTKGAVLSAISLLGAERPAVKGLEGFVALEGSEPFVSAFKEGKPDQFFSLDSLDLNPFDPAGSSTIIHKYEVPESDGLSGVAVIEEELSSVVTSIDVNMRGRTADLSRLKAGDTGREDPPNFSHYPKGPLWEYVGSVVASNATPISLNGRAIRPHSDVWLDYKEMSNAVVKGSGDLITINERQQIESVGNAMADIAASMAQDNANASRRPTLWSSALRNIGRPALNRIFKEATTESILSFLRAKSTENHKEWVVTYDRISDPHATPFTRRVVAATRSLAQARALAEIMTDMGEDSPMRNTAMWNHVYTREVAELAANVDSQTATDRQRLGFEEFHANEHIIGDPDAKQWTVPVSDHDSQTTINYTVGATTSEGASGILVSFLQNLAAATGAALGGALIARFAIGKPFTKLGAVVGLTGTEFAEDGSKQFEPGIDYYAEGDFSAHLELATRYISEAKGIALELDNEEMVVGINAVINSGGDPNTAISWLMMASAEYSGIDMRVSNLLSRAAAELSIMVSIQSESFGEEHANKWLAGTVVTFRAGTEPDLMVFAETRITNIIGDVKADRISAAEGSEQMEKYLRSINAPEKDIQDAKASLASKAFKTLAVILAGIGIAIAGSAGVGIVRLLLAVNRMKAGKAISTTARFI